jgi:hypothetical protein
MDPFQESLHVLASQTAGGMIDHFDDLHITSMKSSQRPLKDIFYILIEQMCKMDSFREMAQAIYKTLSDESKEIVDKLYTTRQYSLAKLLRDATLHSRDTIRACYDIDYLKHPRTRVDLCELIISRIKQLVWNKNLTYRESYEQQQLKQQEERQLQQEQQLKLQQQQLLLQQQIQHLQLQQYSLASAISPSSKLLENAHMSPSSQSGVPTGISRWLAEPSPTAPSPLLRETVRERTPQLTGFHPAADLPCVPSRHRSQASAASTVQTNSLPLGTSGVLQNQKTSANGATKYMGNDADDDSRSVISVHSRVSTSSRASTWSESVLGLVKEYEKDMRKQEQQRKEKSKYTTASEAVRAASRCSDISCTPVSATPRSSFNFGTEKLDPSSSLPENDVRAAIGSSAAPLEESPQLSVLLSCPHGNEIEQEQEQEQEPVSSCQTIPERCVLADEQSSRESEPKISPTHPSETSHGAAVPVFLDPNRFSTTLPTDGQFVQNEASQSDHLPEEHSEVPLINPLYELQIQQTDNEVVSSSSELLKKCEGKEKKEVLEIHKEQKATEAQESKEEKPHTPTLNAHEPPSQHGVREEIILTKNTSSRDIATTDSDEVRKESAPGNSAPPSREEPKTERSGIQFSFSTRDIAAQDTPAQDTPAKDPPAASTPAETEIVSTKTTTNTNPQLIRANSSSSQSAHAVSSGAEVQVPSRAPGEVCNQQQQLTIPATSSRGSIQSANVENGKNQTCRNIDTIHDPCLSTHLDNQCLPTVTHEPTSLPSPCKYNCSSDSNGCDPSRAQSRDGVYSRPHSYGGISLHQLRKWQETLAAREASIRKHFP